MTAKPDLLPLPEMDIYALGSGVGLRDVRHTPVGFSQKKMSEYARANVAHATAALQAEIEALRAEVEMLRDAFSDDDMTAGAHWFGRYVEQKRRAERLAEALRPHIEDLEHSAVVLDQYPAMAPTAAEMRKAAAELRTALHPTAAQENDDE